MVDPLVAAPAAVYAGIGVVGLARPAMVPAMFGGTAHTPPARTGMAAGRLAGSLVEGEVRPWPTGAFLVLEAALAGSLAAALR